MSLSIVGVRAWMDHGAVRRNARSTLVQSCTIEAGAAWRAEDISALMFIT